MKCNVSYKYLFIAIGILCPLFSARLSENIENQLDQVERP